MIKHSILSPHFLHHRIVIGSKHSDVDSNSNSVSNMILPQNTSGKIYVKNDSDILV